MGIDDRPEPEAWLAGRLRSAFRLERASSDASFRSYLRVTLDSGTTHILMDAPPAHEDCQPFVEVARLLRSAGVHAPEILDADLDHGYLLLEDLGTDTYLAALADDRRVDALYADAIDALVTMQGIDASGGTLPEYDGTLLRSELGLFDDWFIRRHLGLEAPAFLATLHDLLVREASAQPRVFVHRDYHSRNLMRVQDRNPGVLDFQDAVHGPVTYDLVSLLRDCYIDWPEDRVEAWMKHYLDVASRAGIETGDMAGFTWWFDLMGVQRQLKATGIFSRLHHRDGKPGYLRDIPRTLGYTLAACRRHDALDELGDWLERTVVPAMRAA